MCPAILDPEVGPTVGRLVQKPLSSWWMFSSIGTENSGRNTGLTELLEVHEPRHVSTVSAQLRRVVDAALGSKLGLWSKATSRSQAKRKIAPLARDHAGVAIVLSTAGSGFVRETAIRNLSKIDGPFCFALLLVRLNDWVREVRTAACEKLTQLIEADPALCSDLALSCMDIVLDQNRFGRADAEQAQVIERLLALPTVMNRLQDTILEGKGDTSPRYLSLVLHHDQFDPWLPMISANATHHRCRALATGALLKEVVEVSGPSGRFARDVRLPVDHAAIAIAGLTDTSVNVRRSALDHVIDKQLSWKGDEAVLLDLVKDPALTVAERARFVLTARNIDFLTPLRQAACAQPPDVCAVRALGKFGTREDRNHAYDAAQRCCPGHRIICLHAAAALGHPAATSDLKSIASTSDILSEARRASRSLQKFGDLFSYQELTDLISTGADVEKRGMLVFIRSLPPVRMARVLAMMKTDASEDRYEPLWWEMTRKRNRGVFQPSSEDLKSLSEELKDKPALSNRVTRILGVKLAP